MIKLNVGCDRDIRPGFVNIDILGKPGVDLVADARHLPFKDGEVDLIVCSHMLEHLSGPASLSTLGEFYRILKPLGCLEIQFPNMAAIAKYWPTLSIPNKIRAMPAVLGGGPSRGPNQIHLTLWDKEMAFWELYDVGFRDCGVACIEEVDINIAKYWLTIAVWKGSREDTILLVKEWMQAKGDYSGSHKPVLQ